MEMETGTPGSATPVYYLLLSQGLGGMGNGNGERRPKSPF
jgi:hypothetical protein